MWACMPCVQMPAQNTRTRDVRLYGATPLPSTLQDVQEERHFRTDVPVLLLPWLVFAMSFSAGALMDTLVVAFLCLLYGMLLSSLIMLLSWRRSLAWRVYSLVCFTSALLGWVGGSLSYFQFPPPASLLPSLGGIMVCLSVLPAMLALAVALGMLLPRGGRCLIGSSAPFAEEHGWGWEPKAMQNMHAGCDFYYTEPLPEIAEDWRQDPPKRVTHDLLYHRTYWSGEPALDYAYYVANNHLWLGCLFAHPGHPFSRNERIFVLLIVSLLVVFPLAALSTVLENGPLKTIIAGLLVTLPRNMLKGRLLEQVVKPDALEEEARFRIGPKFQRLVFKHFTRKSQTKLYSAATSIRVNNAEQSASTFFAVVAALTAMICIGCVEIIRSSQGPSWSYVVLSNMDGLVFGFVLELIFQLCLTAREAWTVGAHIRHPRRIFAGFFHRWHCERLEYGSLQQGAALGFHDCSATGCTK